MDHMLRRELVPLSDFRVPRFATHQRNAFSQQLQPCSPVNCPIHPTAAKQALIGSVHNGINFESGYAALEDFRSSCLSVLPENASQAFDTAQDAFTD